MQGVTPDVNYRIEQFPILDDRQTFFYLRRTEEAVIEAVGPIGGPGANNARLLDVGCGLGSQAARLWLRGWEAHGMDASDEMLRLGQYRSRLVHKVVRSARGIAESIPFRDDSFDVVMCQGAMDHFADPHAFVDEAARVLKPGGRLIIALANYESLSCTVSRTIDRVLGLFGMALPKYLRCWVPPDDHTFKGSYRFLRTLGNGRLRLVKFHGSSMFLFLPPWWALLELLSFAAAKAVFRAVDRAAYRIPVASDVLVAVWQKPSVKESESWRTALAEWERRSGVVPSCLGER